MLLNLTLITFSLLLWWYSYSCFFVIHLIIVLVAFLYQNTCIDRLLEKEFMGIVCWGWSSSWNWCSYHGGEYWICCFYDARSHTPNRLCSWLYSMLLCSIGVYTSQVLMSRLQYMFCRPVQSRIAVADSWILFLHCVTIFACLVVSFSYLLSLHSQMLSMAQWAQVDHLQSHGCS